MRAAGAIRWTRPDQFHLTLRFLGEVPAHRLKDLKQSVEAVCLGRRPIPLRAKGLGLFPGNRSPRVVGEWTATAIKIVRSEPSPDGARHTVLAAFWLVGL